jgi:GGDEF domain-containing protein
VLDTLREWENMTFTADDAVLREVAKTIGDGLRTTDLLGRADEGALAILLIDCGFEQSGRVVDRLLSRIENYNFSKPLRIIVGAAGFPEHATDAASLKRQAIGRPIATLRGKPGSGGGLEIVPVSN